VGLVHRMVLFCIESPRGDFQMQTHPLIGHTIVSGITRVPCKWVYLRIT
jgi:hypothetical protein